MDVTIRINNNNNNYVILSWKSGKVASCLPFSRTLRGIIIEWFEINYSPSVDNGIYKEKINGVFD